MKKYINDINVKFAIKDLEDSIKFVKEMLAKDEQKLENLKFINDYLSEGGFVPLKLKDLDNYEKVNYCALPIKNAVLVDGLIVNESLIVNGLVGLEKTNNLMQKKLKRYRTAVPKSRKAKGMPTCKGRTIEQNNTKV